MSAAAILARYQNQGYRGADLRRRIERHAMILSGLDPATSDALLMMPLRNRWEKKRCPKNSTSTHPNETTSDKGSPYRRRA